MYFHGEVIKAYSFLALKEASCHITNSTRERSVWPGKGASKQMRSANNHMTWLVSRSSSSGQGLRFLWPWPTARPQPHEETQRQNQLGHSRPKRPRGRTIRSSHSWTPDPQNTCKTTFVLGATFWDDLLFSNRWPIRWSRTYNLILIDSICQLLTDKPTYTISLTNRGSQFFFP